MPRSMLALGIAVAVGILIAAQPPPVRAAELAVPTTHGFPGPCGTCGCLRVVYDHHREVLSTYGLEFDPRNYDMTEPRFYLGRVRAYPRYFIEGLPASSVWRFCNTLPIPLP